MTFPYPVSGTITDSEAANPSGAKVIMRNDRTGEKTNTTTNSSGQYLLDAANLTSGYMTSDRLTIICAFGDEEGESSFLISDYLGGHTVNITLSAIAESSDVTYCQVQDVLDFLGDKTTDDISYERIRKTILRAEDEIEDRTNTKFKATTVTDEIYDFNQYTSYKSPERMMMYGGSPIQTTRRDYSGMSFNDTIRLKKYPVISITSLYTNSGGDNAADVWTELTEQEGSAGDFIAVKTIGMIQFVANLPYYGKRRIKVTYVHGFAAVPKMVERLAVLLSVKDVITSKRTESQFDGSASINLGGEINITKFDSATYLTWMDDEIEKLWKQVGDFVQSMV